MIIRQTAFEQNAPKMLKGALHCHTTRSDGKGDPADVIRLHKENNYDFMALTDHRRYNRINYAEDVDITIIPGMEFDNTFVRENGFRCFHTVCIGPNDETKGFAHEERFESGKAADQFEYQPYLDWIHENGNMTIYCHPEWSSTPARYFEKQQGNFAMEFWNTGCAYEDDMDTNAAYWDEILGQGIRIYGVATDDGHPMYQHCKGWVMVNSENDVNSILTALKEGKFYSSCGPVIKDFYVEDGVAHVECEPAARIQFICDQHPTRQFPAPLEQDHLITSVEIDLKDSYQYIRACVIDEQGRRAWTNPIFLKD